MFKHILLAISIALLTFSCSKSVKGPLTGKKYNVQMGGWSDMDKYQQAREEASSSENSDSSSEKPVECNKVDCPDDDRVN